MTEATSIGGVWPPFREDALVDPYNDRVKGFCRESVENIGDLERHLALFDDFQTLRNDRGEREASRITARFFINKNLKLPPLFSDRIEALLPLADEFSQYDLVYFGRNHPERYASPDVIQRQRAAAREIDDTSSFEGLHALDVLARQRVVLRTVKPPVDPQTFSAFVKELLELYKGSFTGDYAFPMTEESVASLVRKDANLVTVIQDYDTRAIYSVGVGETIQIPVNLGGKECLFSMAEISDAATPKKYSNRGYYSAIACELTRELMKMGVHLVYGEARASSTAVEKVCRKSGRRLAWDAYGHPSLLHKHCIISGAKDSDLDDTLPNGKFSRFENLTVWYATRQELLDLYVRNHER